MPLNVGTRAGFIISVVGVIFFLWGLIVLNQLPIIINC